VERTLGGRLVPIHRGPSQEPSLRFRCSASQARAFGSAARLRARAASSCSCDSIGQV
jgi:hypothetical protein